MWLTTTFIAAIIASFLYLKFPQYLRFDLLSLMLWGATLMILVDHILGYEGGSFFETSTDGLVNNAFILGLLMLIPVILIWIVSLRINYKATARSNVDVNE